MADRLTPYLNRGVLTVAQADRPFEDYRAEPALGDFYLAVFRCTNCEEEFQLTSDAYHGYYGMR